MQTPAATPSYGTAEETIVTFVTAVIVPLLATLAMSIMRSGFRRQDLVEFLPALPMDLGWDMCVLGLGLAGTVAAFPNFARLGEAGATIPGVLMLLNIIFGGLVQHFSHTSSVSRVKARSVCMVLGFLAVGLPSALLFV